MNWPRFIGSVAACQAAGGLGAIATQDGLKDWYPKLEKPSFTPPGKVFGPVWTTLYLLMGIAEYIVSQHDGDGENRERAESLFALQLGMNVGWSFLFFKLKSPFAALIELIALLGAVIATIAAFARISRLAAALLAPYLLWSMFATVLNASIWRLNR